MDEGPTAIRKFGHPGGRRREMRPFPKGRQANPDALADVRALLAAAGGEQRLRRDLLIENLHLVQDRFGALRADHLAALAELMRIALAEVYEVASFYAHFDIIDGDAPAPSLTIRVCDSLSCALQGADRLHAMLQGRATAGIRVVRAPCMGRCHYAPVAQVARRPVLHATPETVMQEVQAAHHEPDLPPFQDLDAYRAAGGYGLLADCRDGRRTPEGIIDALEDSALRGLGGAGFPAGRKWRLVRAEPAPRLLAVNADEGEPGTFKDHYLLATDPHRVLEGTMIAAWAVGAAEIYIYLRDEYPDIREILLREIRRIAEAGLDYGLSIHLRRGAGAYICGEESAMLESIEGKRGLPRHKPPYPSQVGLFGRPTLSHNVETLYWVRDIVEKGPAWFAGHGRRGRKGLRAFSVSGRVRNPGVKIAPAGVTAHELIEEFSGGMADGHRLKAYLPGGASGGILPAVMADLPLDFGTLESHGCFVGSGAMIVLSDQDDMKAVVLNLMRFFEDESCGQCTPCRAGTEKAVTLMERPDWDIGLLRELSAAMADASICGLGQAAPNPFLSALKHFPEEVAGLDLKE